MAQFHSLTLSEIEPQGRDGACLSLTIPPDLRETFAFQPGQYLTLRADVDGADLRRPYSICCPPGGDVVQVGVKRVQDGRFSNYLNDLTPGARIDVMPPEGRFTADTQGTHRYLLIAAGSGITPMLSIAESVLQSPGSEVTVVYGNRETGTIMFLDRLSDLKDRHLGRFNIVHLLSREPQDVDIFNGRIDPKKLDALAKAGLIEPKAMDGVFLCGPGTMIDMIEMHLGLLGVPKDRIHFERFLPADGQAPREVPKAVEKATAQGVEVETILDGRRKTFRHTDPAAPVLETARAAGIDLPYSCAGGMCCTCRCRIAEGSAEMIVNYSLEPWELDAGFTLACQARPTSEKLVLDFDAV